MQRQIWREAERRLRWWRDQWVWAMYALLIAVWTVLSLWPEARAEEEHRGEQAPQEERPVASVDGPLEAIAPVAAASGAGARFPASIEAMRRKGADVVELGAAEGLRGFLVRQPDGGTYAAYVTPSGAVVVGLLYAASGEVVTERQLAEARAAGRLARIAAPAPGTAGEGAGRAGDARGADPRARVAGLFEATRAASGFWMGSRGPVIHVFADPTCPFSERHVRALERDADAGRLRAHVIPVGILGERAALRAVEVAGAGDARMAWEGGFAGPVDRGLGAARIETNNGLLERWRVNGVPFSVWTGPRGVRVHYGAGEAAAYASDVVHRVGG